MNKITKVMILATMISVLSSAMAFAVESSSNCAGSNGNVASGSTPPGAPAAPPPPAPNTQGSTADHH